MQQMLMPRSMYPVDLYATLEDGRCMTCRDCQILVRGATGCERGYP